MTDNEFDDILKKRLRQHESQVPANMWERIMGEKRKRRFGFMWRRYLLILIPLLLVSGFYLFHSEQNKTTTKANATSSASEKRSTGNFDSSDKVIEPLSSNNTHLVRRVEKDTRNTSGKRNLLDNEKFNNDNPGINNHNSLPQQNMNDVNQQSKPDSLPATAQKKFVDQQTEGNDNIHADSVIEDEDPDKISLLLFASPDVPFSSISSGNKEYQTLLQNSVQMRLSYTIGAGIRLSVSKRISLSTGIQYSRVNEKISLQDSAASTLGSQNHFGFINIPFTVTYKTKWTTSFQTSINAGILLNISSHYKGMMPGEFGDIIDISHNVYKGNTGISIYAGFNFSKPISDKANIFAEPYFRYQTQNMTDGLQRFTRKIHTAGLALGIQYRLFTAEKE